MKPSPPCQWMYFNSVSVSVSVYKWNVLLLCNLCRNTPFLCPDIVHKTKEDKLFINLSFKFVKTGQSLFSPLWKSVQWLTANFLLDQHHQRNKTEWFGALYQNIMLQTNAISNIEHRNSCSPYLSATLWLSASIQLVAVEEMYHIILATQLQ